MKRVKLLTSDSQVTTINGKYLFTISMTDRAIELLDNDGWDKTNESWLAYRNRTKKDRIKEEIIRNQIATDLVTSYNDKFELS